MFLLMAGAYGAALLLLFARDRRRDFLWALVITAFTAAAVFFSWRAPLTFGLPRWTPGLFAEQYVLPALSERRVGVAGARLLGGLHRLPTAAAETLATGLGVWRMLGLSPFVVVWLASLVRGWRTCGLASACFGLACLLALPMGYAFSVKAIDGAVSPYEFIQASQCLGFLAGVVNVVVLAAVLRRVTPRFVGWTVALTLVAATAIVPTLSSGKTLRTPHQTVLFAPDEVCALLYLRTVTPFDAVVVSARGEGVPAESTRLNYHPVVSGFAGRRVVLEYFWREVDASNDRVRAIRRLFATDDRVEAEQILRRFSVTHVLEYEGRPLRFESSAVRPVYRHGGVRVYRFGESPVAGPPAWIPPAFGLSCDGSHS
jgi:hypothetical protein